MWFQKRWVWDMKNKKRFMILVLSTILIISGCGFLFIKGSDKAVAKVNGEPLEPGFLHMVMEEMRPMALSVYPDGLDSEEAAAYLKDAAFKECIRRMIMLQLAKREGLIDKIDYTSLIEAMEQENRDRKKIKEEGGVVYGILEYDRQTYFTYLFSNLKRELMEKLIYKELKTDDDELYDFYRNHPEYHGVRPDMSTVILWQADENAGLTKEEQKEALSQVREQLLKGAVPWDIAVEHVVKSQLAASKDSRRLNGRPVLKEEIFLLKKGDTSPIVKEGEVFYVIYCLDYEESRSFEFEELKRDIGEVLREEKFEKLLEAKKEEADIKINTSVYENMELFAE